MNDTFRETIRVPSLVTCVDSGTGVFKGKVIDVRVCVRSLSFVRVSGYFYLGVLPVRSQSTSTVPSVATCKIGDRGSSMTGLIFIFILHDLQKRLN